MSFIRLTSQSDNTRLDLNVNHIVGFEPSNDGSGSKVWTSTDDTCFVKESTRQIRSFIKKAQGTLPQASATE